jgi:FAD dependent oxidoreductase TIGR03364
MVETSDAIVVGAGIVGLAHAYALAKRGLTVTVIERDPFATGATVRNFGMIWPIGQPLGERRELALASRDLWVELTEAAGMWMQPCGSLHLAYAEDEFAVLREFVEIAGPEVGSILDPKAVFEKSPAVRESGLLGAFFSPHELCVNPREAARNIAEYLATRWNVRFAFGEPAAAIQPGEVITPHHVFHGRWIFHCPGPIPYDPWGQLLVDEGMEKVRLQMLRAVPTSPGLRLGTHLCAGLTSLHYANFQACSALPALRARLAREWPACIENGIHVLVSQHADGMLTIGDSHHYGSHHMPYNEEWLDDLILEYLDTFLPTELLCIAQRWEGIYGKHPTEPFLVLEPEDRLIIVGALGGAGMTLSFGLGEKIVSEKLD